MSRSRLRPVALLVAFFLVFTACSGDDDDDGGGAGANGDDDTEAADDEDEETTTTLAPEEALAGAGQAAADLPATVESWQAGDVDDDQMRRDARVALVAAGDAREAVAALEDGDESKPLAAGAAELYFQHASTVLEAVNAEGASRDELAALALGLGELAARSLEWALYVQDPDGAEPPQPLPGDTEAPLDRPTQPESAWVAALDELGAPSTIDESADPAQQAEVFRSAAATMGEEADPDTDDGHLVSARLRLDWLVKAAASDAARLGLPNVAAPLTMIDLAVPVVADGENES